MQIRLYNSSNNNHIALRFTEVTSRQLVLPFMLSKPVTRIRLQIVQRIGESESILAHEYYRHSGFRLTNLVLDGSTLKVYANGSVLCIVTVTPMTVDRIKFRPTMPDGVTWGSPGDPLFVTVQKAENYLAVGDTFDGPVVAKFDDGVEEEAGEE